MRLDDIEIGEEYAAGKRRFPDRVKVEDIRKVTEKKRFGRKKTSNRRKVVAAVLDDEGEPTGSESVYEAQQVHETWEERERRREEKQAKRKEKKQRRKERRKKTIGLQEDVLSLLEHLDGFETREVGGIARPDFDGVRTSIERSGKGKVELTYERLLELADKLDE